MNRYNEVYYNQTRYNGWIAFVRTLTTSIGLHALLIWGGRFKRRITTTGTDRLLSSVGTLRNIGNVGTNRTISSTGTPRDLKDVGADRNTTPW